MGDLWGAIFIYLYKNRENSVTLGVASGKYLKDYNRLEKKI